MSRCFRLNLIIVKKSFVTYLVLFLIAIAFSVTISSSFGIAYLFVIMVLIARTPFSYEANTKISKFTYGLPVKKTDHVKGRYMYLITFLVIAWIISSVIIVLRYNEGTFKFVNVISCISSGLLLSIVAMVQYPLYYKLGIIKGNLWSLIINTIPIIIAIALPQITLDGLVGVIPEDVRLILLGTVGILVLCLCISYIVSQSIIKNKEV